MPIVYALVARGKSVLAEYTNLGGNFTTVTRVLLSKIVLTDATKMSYVYDNHVFHYHVDGGMIFMCMVEQEVKKRTAFSFLEGMLASWRGRYAATEQTATAFAMQQDFSKELARLMKHYNSGGGGGDNISKVQLQIESVKEVMVENIDQLLERGEKIELLVDRTDRLNQTAVKFERSTRALKNDMLWRKVKMYLFILLAVAVLCLFIAMSICGGDLQECPGGDDSK